MRYEEEVTISTSIWVRLARLYTLALRNMRKNVNTNITIQQFDILSQLSREKNGISMVEISKRLLVTQANITGVVGRLEKQNLIKRYFPEDDRRKTIIKLTEKGRSILKKITPIYKKTIHKIFSRLPKDLRLRLREDLNAAKEAILKEII